ncbi:MAG: putative Ig domain-containing protein, partial [Nitrospira sp.]|nr:putative Ig domain-containing protein [Nitrospira sp.]
FTSSFVVDHVGPRIVAQTPATQASSPWNSLTVTFSEPINPATFTAADVVMTGPTGAIPITAITGSGATYTLTFANQTTAGAYTLTIGPNVTDLVGNLMDQNGNGVNGEAGTADAYQSTILLQAPNLRVVTVTTDPVNAAQFGQPITVTWSVENAGTDPAREAWSDRIWLSTNQTLETGTDIPLGLPIPSGLTGPLDPLATYQQTATVTLPLTTALAAGTYYLIVETDTGKTQLETNEADNSRPSAALSLTVPPVPDLVVTAITAPVTAQPGQTIPLTWTVRNQGGAAATGTWTDYVYLSSDASIGADRYVAAFTYTGTLEANASVERTQTVTLPTDLTGAYRVVIQTDAGTSHIYEHDQEINNTAIDDAVLTIIAPDLQVSNIQLPANSFSGQPLTVTWTLTNTGSADFTGTVSDRLALSGDATIGSDTFVADVPWTGTLAIGESVQRSHTFTLDRNLSGTRWAVVTTDIGGQINEYPNEGNNQAISAQPTTITLQFSDLVVDAVSTSTTAAQSGDSITVSWRVRNQGALATNLSAWTDRLVLAASDTLGTTFHILKSVNHIGSLDPEGTYTGQATVTLPNGIAGAYHVFVQTDYVEASTNGVLFEATGEGNNTGRTVTPLDLTLKPYPDFQVTSVSGPTDVQPGQSVTLSWTVANTGPGSSSASHLDKAYLSANGTTTGAHYLGQVAIPAGTEPGSSYPASLTATLPSSVADGTYRFLIVSDAGGASYEGPTGGDLNNTGHSDPVSVTHPDLRATILSAPTSAASGATVRVDYQVTNHGSGPAQGTWTDRVYLSTDGTVDTNDVVRGQRSHTGPLAAGASDTGWFDVVIPLDKSGPWYLLVKTDADTQVTETPVGNAEGNNVAAAPITVTLSPYADLAVSDVTVDPLVIGDPGIVTVGWTVTNTTAGTGTGVTDTWTDAVIASTDPVLGNADDWVLATFAHTGLLSVGEQYSQRQTFYLPGFVYPNWVEGRYHLFVKTDSTGAVFENSRETNNVAEAGNQLDAMRIPYADLQVEAITVPATAQTGTPMRVSWIVRNHGIGLTNATIWSDRVWLAGDAAGQQILHDYGRFSHTGQLQPDGSYERAVELVLPDTLSGPVYVVVQTGQYSSVFEFLSSTNNKTVSTAPVVVSLSPTPDLIVTSLQGPVTAFEGGTIDLTWTVTNDGQAEATGSWRDTVVLRKVGDTSGAGTITVGDFVYDRGLLAGQSYTRTESFTLPAFIQGEYQLEVTTDVKDALFERNLGAGTGEANNTTGDTAFLTLQLRPRPDLQIANVVAPARVEAGGTVSLEFTVINQGTAATPSLWKDSVYLSLDNVITPDDLLIGTFDNVSALKPSAESEWESVYSRTTPSVPVPIRYRGNVYLLVKPDSGNQVEEFPNEGNNLYAQPLYVEPFKLADLVTGNVVAPDQVLPGTQVEVRYRVENRGSNVTNVTAWTDTIWLTVDKTRPFAGKGDMLLGTVTHQGALPVGDFYEQVVTVTIPDADKLKPGINTYYLTPWSDTYDVVLEDTLDINLNPDDRNQLDNNNYKARPVIVIGNQPPLPAPVGDLAVVSVTPVTPVAEATQPFTVRWSVQNLGPGAVSAGWTEEVYLSTTPDLVGGQQWQLELIRHQTGVAAGEVVAHERTYQLSPQTTGTYVVVRTGFPYEPNQVNNLVAVPVGSAIAAPDLQVASVIVPSSADSGESVLVQWTVENVGSAPVWAGTQYWTDVVYFSADPTFIPSRALKVGERIHSQAEPLAAGGSYQASMDVTLPAGIEGPYFIYVLTDATSTGQVQPELFASPGSNETALGYYRTRVYEGGSNANNLLRASLPVVYKEADLRTTGIVAEPNPAFSGQPLTVTWTVTNAGTRATRESFWSDQLFLSRDSSLDTLDLSLGRFDHRGSLAQGASYEVRKTVTLPIGLAGDFYLLVLPDTTDRFGATDAVREYRGEGNNLGALALPIILTTPPDLQVTQLTSPDRVTTGQSFTVTYRVANEGGSDTPAVQDRWDDRLYLSRDTFFDPQADRYLGLSTHTGGLAAGAWYDVTTTLTAPSDLTGAYYVLVVTDPRSSSGTSQVFEGTHEQNNDRVSVQPLVIELPPPADLEVQAITTGGTVRVGDPLSVSWTVINHGPNVATGTWTDSVYLSTDDTWDLSDRLLGQQSFSGPVAQLGTYTLSLDAVTPPVAAGQYRVIVRTDIRNQVYEDANEGNNRRFSPDPVTVTVEAIQLGVPVQTTLSTGQDRLYKVTVLEGETLRVRVSSATGAGANEVYLRFNEAPTRFAYDAGPNTQLQADTAAIVPATRPGDYYILLHGQSEPGPHTPVTLLADTLPFGITDIATDQGGDSRYVTVRVTGAQFAPGAVVKLVQPDVAEFVPVNLTVVDSTQILATFDFTEAPRGLYDVTVINADGARAILPYRFVIERYIEPDVTIGLGGPRVIAAGDTGTYGVALQSLTNLDTPYVSFQFGVAEMGRNNVIYNLPFVQTFNNLRGAPDGVRGDVPWASLVSDLNAAGPLSGYNASTGYVFDLAADGYAGATFTVTTYAGLQELADRSWEALKEKIYNIDPSLRDSGVLDNGPQGLDQIFPGLYDIYSRVADPVGACKAWAIPFRFNIFAAATALTRDEFIAQQTAEARTLREKILADSSTTASIQTLQTLAADADVWVSAYLAALEEGGLLRPVDAIPPVRQDPKIVSLLGVFATGVLVGPAGEQFQTNSSLLEFFDKIHSWYGDREEFVPWPIEERLPPPHCPESSALIPITSVPESPALDLGLSHPTHVEGFDVFVPWIPFGQRGAAGTVALPDFQSTDATTSISALEFSQFYDAAAAGGQTVAIVGPQGSGAEQFVPTGQRLPYQIRFENPATASTRPGEIRIVSAIDADLDPRTIRLGDIELGDLRVHIPSDRATFQGDFNFVQSKGFLLRVSAGVDVAQQTATWLLQAIDPETGEVMQDTTKGLLAQNNAQGAGLGSVSYSVLAGEDLATGTTITAQARVLFNTAPPADATEVTQTIDGRAPVTTLTATKLGTSDDYQVQWTAVDDAGGSGVRHTTVYVAEDGGGFTIWQQRTTETSGIYQGRAGHTYEFFAVSTDRAGNRELPPLGLNGPDDGTTTNLGSLPAGATTPTDLPPPPAPTPSTNPLFVQVQAQIPGTQSVIRPSDFTSVLSPFTAQSFATGFQQSHGIIGPLALLPLADGSVLASGGFNRGELFRFSPDGGRAITPLITLDQPIYDLALDANGRLWAASGSGVLLELDQTTGEILHQFGEGLTQALAIHPTTGKIYLSSGDGIEIFDPVTLRFSHFTNYRVDDLAFSPTGELWGTSWPTRGDVVKFATNGKASVMVRLDSQVDSIAFGQAGTPLENLLFVSSNGGDEGEASDLVMVDIVSLQTTVIARGGPRAETIATTADGRLFLAQADQIDVLQAVVPPVVVATTPIHQGFAPLPIGTITVRFDQDMFVADPTTQSSVLNPHNYVLTGQTGGAVAIHAVQYDAATRTARLDVDALQTDTYTLTVSTEVLSRQGLGLLTPHVVTFTAVSDVSDQVQLDFLNVRSDRANATLSYDVQVTNTSTHDLLAPVRLVLDPAQYFQGAPIGATISGGFWLLELGAGLSGGILAPGQSTVVQTVTLANPFAQRADLGYGVYAMAPANVRPVVLSTPELTATAGQAYSYQVLATDPDGTTVTYFLADAPEGMTLSETGLLSWTPTVTSPEQASVILQVYDGRGSFTAQAFTIEVTGVNGAPVVLDLPTGTGTAAEPVPVYQIREGQPFELGLIAADPDADPLVFFADHLPPGATFDHTRGVITWTPGPQAAGTYDHIVLSVTDGLHTVSRSFTLLVAPTNEAPVLAQPADRTIREGEPIRIQLVASDPDSSGLSTQHSALRYFSDFLPGGATLDPVTGVFEWTPGFTQAGTYRVPFSVQGSDPLPPGSDPAPVTTVWTTFTVTNVNAAPQFDTIGDLEILENQRLFIRTFAFDPDNPGFIPQDRLFDGTLTPLEGTDPTVTYTITGLPTGATFDPVSAQLSWLPTFDQAGTYQVTVTATDEGTGLGTVPLPPGTVPVPLSSSVVIPITVVNVNRPPVLPDITNQVVTRGETLELPVTATDADGNPLTLIAVSGEGQLVPEEAPLPRFATFQDFGNGQGLFRFTPTVGDRGNYTITLYAMDNGDPTPLTPDPLRLTALETFVVQVNSPSEPPVLQYVGNQVAVVGQSLQFTVRATDLDQDPLTFTMIGLPSNATITPGAQYGTAVVSWTPTSEQLGSFPVTIRVTDNGNNGAVGGTIGVDERTITIVSRVTNQSPVLQPIGDQTAAERQPFTLQLVATDADGDQLTFSGTNLPAGSTLDPVTGLFTWTPTFTQAGTYDGIRFTVSDGNKSQSETIRITVANTNRPPTVIPLTAQSGREQARVNFTIAAADLDAESLTFSSLTPLPAGAHFDGKTGEFEWTPDFTQAGTYRFTFQAQDPSGATGTTDVTVRIADVNRPPVLSLTNHQVLIGQEAVFQLLASDPDSPPSPDVSRLTFHAVGLPEGATLDETNGLFRWTPGIGQIGDYLMLVTVSDGQATTTDSFVLRAGTELQTPHVQIDLTPSFPVVPGQKVLASVLASSLAEIVSTTISVNGQPVTFDHLGRAVITAGGPGELVVRATATDADGVTGTTETVLKIKNPDDRTAPLLAFDGAVPGMVVRDASAIRATILDSDLDSWTLEIAHANSDAFSVIASGSTPILSTQSSALSTLDPSGYSNGFYRLRLTAQDVAGRRAETEALIEINSAVKTAQFTHSEMDLTVTLDGHVFDLVRQYDSLEASTVTGQSQSLAAGGSFGNGWRLANRDVNLETNASALTPDSSPAFRAGTRLYLTLPTGERVGYTFTPERHTVNGVKFYTPAFTPDPLVTWTLSPVSSTKLIKAGEHFYDFLTGEAYNPVVGLSGLSGSSGADVSALSPQHSALVLTGPNGTQYKLTAQGQIGEEIRPDGKKFIWSDSGLTAVSTGETVQFTWTALSTQHSALSSLSGPDGHRLVYTYDQQGNLVSARDLSTGDTSRYGYAALSTSVSALSSQHSALTLITHTGQPGSVITYPAGLSPQSSVLKADLGAALSYLQTPYQGTLDAGSVDQLVFAVRPSEIIATNSGDVYVGVIVEGTDPLLPGSVPLAPAVPTIAGLTPVASSSNGGSSFGLFRIERDGLYLLNVSALSPPVLSSVEGQSSALPYSVRLFIAGDANRDGRVDGVDGDLLTNALAPSPLPLAPELDANQDGVLNSADLHLYRQNLGFIPNQAPTATNATAKTHQDLELLFPVTVSNSALSTQSSALLSDPENDPIVYRITGAMNGTARIASNGTSVSFTPTTGYSGPASFSIVADDGYATSQVATVTVNVSDAPLVALDFTVRQPRLDARHATTLELIGDFTDEQDVLLPASYLTFGLTNLSPQPSVLGPGAVIAANGVLTGVIDGTTGIVTASTAHGPNGAVIQAATAFSIGLPTDQTQQFLYALGLDVFPGAVSLAAGTDPLLPGSVPVPPGQRQILADLADVIQLTDAATGTRYFVSNPDVVTVSADGLITALNPGEAVVTVINGPAETLIPVKVQAPPAPGARTIGVEGGIVMGADGSLVALAPHALETNTLVSITPVLQASLPLAMPGPFEYVASFDLQIGDGRLDIPAQLAIPITGSTLTPGADLVFFRASTLTDETGAPFGVWMQEETGIFGADGVARTASPPFPGVLKSGTWMIATAPAGSLARVDGKLNTFFPDQGSSFTVVAPMSGAPIAQEIHSPFFLYLLPGVAQTLVFYEFSKFGAVNTTEGTVTPEAGTNTAYNITVINAVADGNTDASAAPQILTSQVEFINGEAELVLTGNRFTFAPLGPPTPPADGSNIDHLLVNFEVPIRKDQFTQAQLDDFAKKKLPVPKTTTITVQVEPSSDGNTARVKIPKEVILGLANVSVTRPTPVFDSVTRTWKVDETTQRTSDSIKVAVDLHHLFVANNFDDDVAVVDTKTDALITRIPVGLPGGLGGPRSVALTPDLTRAYVTLLHDHGLAVIDTHTLQAVDVNPAADKVETTITIEGAKPYGAVVDKDGKYLYVSDFNVGTVYVIDIDPVSETFHTVVKTISIKVAAEGLRGMDITADGRRLYVAAPLKGGAAAFSKDQYPNGHIVVIDTDTTTPGNNNLWTVITDQQVLQEPYAVKASATDPTLVTFTNRRSDAQGFGIIRATNSAHSSLKVSYVPLTLGSKLDSFDVNDASSIAILPAGTLPNQPKDYAFVTGWNRIQQGDPSRDPFLRESLTLEERVNAGLVLVTTVGGNIGVIEDPFGTEPKLVAATSGEFLGMPDGLALSADGLMLYAAFSGENAVRRFDVQLLLDTMAANTGGSVVRKDGTFTTLATTPLAGPDFPGIHAYHPLNQAIEFSPIGTGRFPQGMALAESSKVTIGFGREDNALSTEILGTAEPGDTTPIFRWKVDWADPAVRNGATSKLFVSVFPSGKGLFPSDFDGGDTDATKDLGRHRILNGVEAVHRFTQEGDLFEFDLGSEVARALTLGQTYYIGVKTYDGVGNIISTASRAFKLEQAEPTDLTKFSSVTVLTHGFQNRIASLMPGGPDHTLAAEGQWLQQLADQIVDAGGGSPITNVLIYRKATGIWADVNGATTPVAGKPLVLISDWWTESDINDSGFSEAAGDALFASLVSLDKTLRANPNDVNSIGRIFNSPLHFIAHSRGTIVTSELLQRLGEYENRVLSHQSGYRPLDIHLTTLDVHDEFGIDEKTGAVIDSNGQTNLTPLGIDWTDFNEPNVYVWDNVDFADNYYQELGVRQATNPSLIPPFFASATPNGRLLSGADLNIRLNGVAGFLTDDANLSTNDSLAHAYLGPHSRVWRWYAGTTDLSIDSFEVDIPGNEPLFRSLTDVPRFTPSEQEAVGGGGTLPWYVPLADYTSYYGQPSFTVGVDKASWEGIGVGWWYSELGGGETVRPAATGVRTALSVDNTNSGETPVTAGQVVWTGSKIPSVFNGNFEEGNMRGGVLSPLQAVIRGTSIPGWDLHSDPTIGTDLTFTLKPGKIVFYPLTGTTVSGHAVELEGNSQIVHNRFYIPTEASSVQFSYNVRDVELGPGDIPRQPELNVILRVDGQEHILGTLATTLTAPQVPPSGTADYLSKEYVIPQNLRGVVGELIFRLTFIPGQPAAVSGHAKIWIDNVRLGPTGAALQAESIAQPETVALPLTASDLTSLIDASRAGWLGMVETPDGRTGVTLGSFGGTTPEFTMVNDWNEQKDRNAGFGEGGLNDQGFFTDSHPSRTFISPYETARDLGVGFFSTVRFANQFGLNSYPSLSPDSHAIETQYESALFGESDCPILSQIIVNHDAALHAGIGIGGALVGEGAVGISNFDLSRDLATPCSNGAISDLEILQFQELALQPFHAFTALRLDRNGLEHSSTFVSGTSSLGQRENQQSQGGVSHASSFGTPTLPPDRKSVNGVDGNGHWPALSFIEGPALSAVEGSSAPNVSALSTQSSALSSEQLSLLSQATIAIDDLPDGYLALTLGTTITLDTD